MLAVVVGQTMIDPWVSRLEVSARESPEDAPSPQLLEVIGEPRARVGTATLMALIVILVFLMVVKPLG